MQQEIKEEKKKRREIERGRRKGGEEIKQKNGKNLLTFAQGQVLHHPPRHVASSLVGDELEHAAVRGARRGAVLGAEEHGVLDVEGRYFWFFFDGGRGQDVRERERQRRRMFALFLLSLSSPPCLFRRFFLLRAAEDLSSTSS